MPIYKLMGKRGRATIPHVFREFLGFEENTLLAYELTEDGDALLVRRVEACDGCEGVESQDVSLYDFLNELTTEEKQAAIVHLMRTYADEVGREVMLRE